jgi:hypothetical protein
MLLPWIRLTPAAVSPRLPSRNAAILAASAWLKQSCK